MLEKHLNHSLFGLNRTSRSEVKGSTSSFHQGRTVLTPHSPAAFPPKYVYTPGSLDWRNTKCFWFQTVSQAGSENLKIILEVRRFISSYPILESTLTITTETTQVTKLWRTLLTRERSQLQQRPKSRAAGIRKGLKIWGWVLSRVNNNESMWAEWYHLRF